MMWNRVDLPEPDGPTMERNSPGLNVEIHAAQRRHVHLADPVGLAQVAGLDDAPLLIGQRLDGVLPRRAQAGIERAQKRVPTKRDRRHAMGHQPYTITI